MTRKKVKLEYIADDSSRKATFKKRKKGILKKVNELTILCGIKACAVISNPFDSQTEFWPNLEGAKQVIGKYQNSLAIDENKNMNRKSFMLQRIAKAEEQLKKQLKENQVKELHLSLFEYLQDRKVPDDLSIAELKEIDKLIDQNMEDIENKMDAMD